MNSSLIYSIHQTRVALYMLMLVVPSLAIGADTSVSRVLVIAPDQAEPSIVEAITRLKAELGAGGFEVVGVTATGPDPRAEVERSAAEAGAFAAIAVVSTADGTAFDIWISDEVTGKTVVRQFSAHDTSGANDDASVIAVRAVELLYASLLELKARPSNTRHEPPPKAVAEWMTAEEVRRGITDQPDRPFGISFSGGARYTRRIGFSFGPIVAVSYRLEIPLGFRASLTGPFFAGEVSKGDDSALLREEFLLLHLTSPLQLVREQCWLVPRFGAGAHHLHSKGKSRERHAVRTDDAWSFALDSGIGTLIKLTERIALDLNAHMTLTLPSISIHFGRQEVARSSQPAVYLMLGIHVRL